MSMKRSIQASWFRRLILELLENRELLSVNPFPVTQSDTVMVSTAVTPGDKLETLALLVPMTGNSANNNILGLNDAKNLYGLDGSGQTVVIIDSGIAYSHVDLGGGFGDGYRVIGGYDFADGDFDPYDSGPRGSHGTHVAGIIASSSTQFPGIATGVDLVALRIFNDDGTSNMQYLIDALQWVHENKDTFANPITTINLSVGFQIDSNGYFDQINNWFRVLNDDGIFISVAAGNAFESISDKSLLSYPAMSEYVVAVGSVGTNGNVSSFSQRNETTIMAPGQFVKSTVPDYAGNRNGIDDDYSTFSGTSMAAPYVAGASTLIRQAMQLVGMTDITQQRIYDVIVATADKIYDAVTGQYLSRLNVKNAIESILPQDTFGNSIADATRLGTIIDTMDIDGFFNTKTDKDYFTFIAGKDGTIIVTPEMSAGVNGTWDISAIPGAVVADGTITLTVTAGQTYTLGFNATGKIGGYALNARYVGETTNPGGETANPEDDTDTGDTTDPCDDTDIGDTTDPGNLDHQENPSSDSIVHQVGTEVFVIGTDRDDEISWTAGATHLLVVNDMSYAFDAGTITNICIDGRGGGNTVRYFGTGSDESITINDTMATIIGQGYTVEIVNAQYLDIDVKGTNTTATLTDTPGETLFTGSWESMKRYSAGQYVEVRGCTQVNLTNVYGGNNTVRLEDSTGDDTLYIMTNSVSLVGAHYGISVRGFDYVHTNAVNGGNNKVMIYDAQKAEKIIASGKMIKVIDRLHRCEADGFDEVLAFGNKTQSSRIDNTGTDYVLNLFGRWEDNLGME